MGGTEGLGTGGERFAIITALNVDWDRLANGSSGLVVNQWAETHRALLGCSTLSDVLRAVARNSDQVLSALLTEHAGGCQLAGRTILQSLLGKIVLLSLRDANAEVGDYVGAMWCRICTYPLDKRPVKIAANLALDTLKAVKREKQWGRRGMFVATTPNGPYLYELQNEAILRVTVDHNAELSALTATRVVARASHLGLIDVPTRAVLLSVYSDGLTGLEAADRHETTVDMIRFRCSKAVRRLAQHAALLADAA